MSESNKCTCIGPLHDEHCPAMQHGTTMSDESISREWLMTMGFQSRGEGTYFRPENTWLWMFVRYASISPHCHCGDEPYTDGASCPTCQAILLISQKDQQMESISQRGKQ